MLVLSRKVGERIHVGDEIILEIRRIAGNRVTVALDAPRHVRILRGELESAAREFDDHPVLDPSPRIPTTEPVTMATAQPVTVLHHIPVHPANRECVT